jgi:hypothetical protein
MCSFQVIRKALSYLLLGRTGLAYTSYAGEKQRHDVAHILMGLTGEELHHRGAHGEEGK